MNMNQLIIVKKPIITEKSLKDAQMAVFTFEVDRKATKREIRNEVQKLFQVHVLSITTVTQRGKRKMVGKKRKLIKKPDIKIARLQLKKGEKIEFFEVGEKK